MLPFFEAERPHDEFTYDAYLKRWKEEKDVSLTADMDSKERKLVHYKRYNYERSQAVHAAYETSGALRDALDGITEPQFWMVLTETWCGDSAYNLPVIAEAATRSPHVTLRILLRDDNPDIMDRYLTDGSRSIPKLVAFDEQGNELFTWGPRPERLRALRSELIAEEYGSKEVISRLLERYEDGAWKEVDRELTEAIQSAQPIAQ